MCVCVVSKLKGSRLCRAVALQSMTLRGLYQTGVGKTGSHNLLSIIESFWINSLHKSKIKCYNFRVKIIITMNTAHLSGYVAK